MKIKWEIGYEIEKPFGYHVKGLSYLRERPNEFIIFLDELKNIDMLMFINYIKECLKGYKVTISYRKKDS